jgi:O-antigen/teichoic acid export membrane protein
VLKNIGRYAAGLGIAAILAQVVAQMDKLIVSKLVSDTQFGYYIIAGNVAILVNNVSFPMYMAILPHFTKLFFENRREEIKKEYHFYTRLLSCLLLPFSVVVFFYSKEFLWLWTKNAELSEAVSPILKLMIAGTTLNAMVAPIQTLLLANNKVRFILFSNLVGFVLAIPVIILLTLKFGVTGGATSVLVIFAGYFAIQAPMIFRKLQLKNSLFQWYLKDILFFLAPLLILSFILAQLNKYIITADRWRLFLNLSAIILFYYGVTLLLNKQLRGFLHKKYRALIRQQPV